MTKYLVITGGSHGIGEKAIALFMREGFRAINISRTNCQISGVININIDLASEGWSAKHSNQLQKTVKDAEHICLVHNAASFKSDSVTTLSESELRNVLNVNLISSVSLNKILIPMMKPKSSIIYIGTTLAEMAVKNRASYVISKHAVIGLMRATTQDLHEHQIHTCCICPGFVNTNMLTAEAHMPALMEFIKNKVIAKRLIEPEEIADYIYFCATHPIVNGSVLHANLGQVMS